LKANASIYTFVQCELGQHGLMASALDIVHPKGKGIYLHTRKNHVKVINISVTKTVFNNQSILLLTQIDNKCSLSNGRCSGMYSMGNIQY